MAKKSPAEVSGIEFDWLATDGNGNVALFTTAGGGYAPEEFLRDTDAHDAAIDSILASPPRTDVRFSPELPSGLQNTWHRMAERGIFAFDSDPNGGPYQLVAAPKEPIGIADLPADAAVVVRRLVFPDLRFSDSREVTKSSLVRCRT